MPRIALVSQVSRTVRSRAQLTPGVVARLREMQHLACPLPAVPLARRHAGDSEPCFEEVPSPRSSGPAADGQFRPRFRRLLLPHGTALVTGSIAIR